MTANVILTAAVIASVNQKRATKLLTVLLTVYKYDKMKS